MKIWIWSLHLLLLKQAPSARARCWGLSLLLRVLWSLLWKEPLLHIPLSPVLCLLRCRGWLCWHLCLQLLVELVCQTMISRIAFNITFLPVRTLCCFGFKWFTGIFRLYAKFQFYVVHKMLAIMWLRSSHLDSLKLWKINQTCSLFCLMIWHG